MISSTYVLFFRTIHIPKLYNHSNFYRYVRSIAKRGTVPKLVEGKVRTLTQYDDLPKIQSYQDLIRDIKESDLGDELEVEKAFVNEDLFGDPLEKSERFFGMHLKEERSMKSLVKKQIIKNKYFKLDKETNLLTYAAKEQIRFLHKSNPQEWNAKALAECFTTTEAGVKRLLKSSFTLTNPDKIKAHDKEVAERWEVLKSGKFSTSISPLTQKLYREGKLKDDYFSGNPNLPTKQPDRKVIKAEVKKKTQGEFSQIVQTYVEFEKQKLLANSSENASENQVIVKDQEISYKEERKLKVSKYKYASEEFDKKAEEVYIRPKKVQADKMDLPLSRFKEILQEEDNISLLKDDLPEKSKQKCLELEKYQTDDTFNEVPKYERDNIETMRENNQRGESIYKYDDQLGYQHPVGKTIKRKIKLPLKLQKKGKLFRKGQYVFSENGEFLYKMPI